MKCLITISKPFFFMLVVILSMQAASLFIIIGKLNELNDNDIYIKGKIYSQELYVRDSVLTVEIARQRAKYVDSFLEESSSLVNFIESRAYRNMESQSLEYRSVWYEGMYTWDVDSALARAKRCRVVNTPKTIENLSWR